MQYTQQQLKDLATKIEMIAKAQGDTGFDYVIINEDGDIGYYSSGFNGEDGESTYIPLEDINAITEDVCAKYTKEREEAQEKRRQERIAAQKQRQQEEEERERQTLRELKRKYPNV